MGAPAPTRRAIQLENAEQTTNCTENPCKLFRERSGGPRQ